MANKPKMIEVLDVILKENAIGKPCLVAQNNSHWGPVFLKMIEQGHLKVVNEEKGPKRYGYGPLLEVELSDELQLLNIEEVAALFKELDNPKAVIEKKKEKEEVMNFQGARDKAFSALRRAFRETEHLRTTYSTHPGSAMSLADLKDQLAETECCLDDMDDAVTREMREVDEYIERLEKANKPDIGEVGRENERLSADLERAHSRNVELSERVNDLENETENQKDIINLKDKLLKEATAKVESIRKEMEIMESGSSCW